MKDQIFALKIKILHEGVNETCTLFVSPPNKILNPTHTKFNAKTFALNDKISVELY